MANWRWRFCSKAVLVAALALAGCGGGDGGPPSVPVVLDLWNRSQFPLEAVVVHPTEDYVGRGDLVVANMLQVDAVVTLDDFLSRSYVTVIREQVLGGPAFALTTAQRIGVPEDGYMLVIFDQSFRLLSPADIAAGAGP